MNWLKKDCERYREMISVLLDGELSESELLQLKTHLAECDDCSTLCVAFAAVDGAMQETMVDVPASLHRNIMAKVNQEARTRKNRRLRKVLRPVLATAACLAVIVGTVLVVRPMLTPAGSAVTASSGAANAGGFSANAPADAGAEMNTAMAPAAAPAAGAGAAAQDNADLNEYTIAESEAETAEVPASAPADDARAANTVDSADAAEDLPQDAPAPMPLEASEASSEPAAEAEGDGNEKALMSLELEVLSVVSDDGSFQGAIVSDASGLLSPGVKVTVRPAEDAAPEGETDVAALQPGDRITVRFDALSVIPDGWLVSAQSIESE